MQELVLHTCPPESTARFCGLEMPPPVALVRAGNRVRLPCGDPGGGSGTPMGLSLVRPAAPGPEDSLTQTLPPASRARPWASAESWHPLLPVRAGSGPPRPPPAKSATNNQSCGADERLGP